MLPNKHNSADGEFRKSNGLYSNKCKSTLNSHIKDCHNFNFAKLEMTPRKKSQDELSRYETQRQRLEWKRNGLHNEVQASILKAKENRVRQRRTLEKNVNNKKWGEAKNKKANKTLESSCALECESTVWKDICGYRQKCGITLKSVTGFKS